MRTIILMLATALVLAACDQDKQLAELTPVAQRALTAAQQGDSAAIAELTADSIAARRLQLLARSEPDLVSAGVRNLQMRDGWVRGDTAGVNFTVPAAADGEVLQMTFVRHENRWLLRYITLPDRG